jgi:hypothetical protein
VVLNLLASQMPFRAVSDNWCEFYNLIKMMDPRKPVTATGPGPSQPWQPEIVMWPEYQLEDPAGSPAAAGQVKLEDSELGLGGQVARARVLPRGRRQPAA